MKKASKEDIISFIGNHLVSIGRFPGDAVEFGEDTDLFDDTALDSMDMTELGLFLEDEYGVEVTEAIIQAHRKAGQVADYILSRWDDEN